MKMNRVFIPAMVASVILSSSAMAASSNTITFMGEVTDQTCSININGSAAAPVVLLPSVATSVLAKSADTAGTTNFDVGVSGCTANPAGMNVSSEFVGNNISSTTGNLANSGTASNVEIQILDTTGKDIDFRNAFRGAGDLALQANETQKTASYSVQYYATGAATVGTVQASMQYAVSYQ